MRHYLLAVVALIMLFASSSAMAVSITAANENGLIYQGSIMGTYKFPALDKMLEKGEIDQGKYDGAMDYIESKGWNQGKETPNPEPTTLLLMALSLGGAALLRKKFKKKI